MKRATIGRPATHEDFSREDRTPIGSERNFGLVFAGLCAVVAGVNWWHGNTRFWAWASAAVIFAAIALAAPRLLRPLNIVWFKLGMLLHHIVSPVVLGLMFFAVFTPVGWCMRAMRKRPLHLRFDREA